MTTRRLQQHYEDKYESASAGPPNLIPLGVKRPRDRYEAACAFLPPLLPRNADVLELGAGSGNVARSLVEGLPIRSYSLGDISRPRLDAMRAGLGGEQYRFVEADADDVTESLTDTYDAVVMIALIEHLVDPLGSMDAVRRVLKPGGFVYIDTPNIAKWTRRVKLALGRFPSTASVNEGLTTYYGEPADLHDEGHLHYFTYRSLEQMLMDRCGFTHAQRLGYYPDPRLHGIGSRLAKTRPTLFSELACVAYA